MCGTVASIVLITTNIGVLLVGIALTVIGGLLEWGRELLASTVNKLLGALTSTSAVPAVNMNNISALLGDYIKYLSAAGLVIFIVGLVLFVIAICGVCGACRKSKLLLVIYMTCVGIILAGLIVLTCLIAFKKDEVRIGGENLFKKYIQDTFVGLSAGSNAQSAILSLIMARLSCCGVTNSTDFNLATNWNRTYEFPNGTYISLSIPLSCCKMKPGSYTPLNESCLTDPTTANSNMDTGCYTKLWQLIDAYSNYTMYALIALCVVLFLLIVCAVAVIKSASKETTV